MTTVGPATESGAPVVRSGVPLRVTQDRVNYLMRMVRDGLPAAWPTALVSWETIRDRVTQAAESWTREVDGVREQLSIAHDRIAQLEEALAEAHEEAKKLEARMAEERRAHRDAFRECADVSARRRRALAVLAGELHDEMQRGGGA